MSENSRNRVDGCLKALYTRPMGPNSCPTRPEAKYTIILVHRTVQALSRPHSAAPDG